MIDSILNIKISFYLVLFSLLLNSCTQIKKVNNLKFSKKPYMTSSVGGRSKIATHIQFHDSTFTEITYNYNKIDTIRILENKGCFSQEENKVSLLYYKYPKPTTLKLVNNKLTRKKVPPFILNNMQNTCIKKIK